MLQGLCPDLRDAASQTLGAPPPLAASLVAGPSLSALPRVRQYSKCMRLLSHLFTLFQIRWSGEREATPETRQMFLPWNVTGLSTPGPSPYKFS